MILSGRTIKELGILRPCRARTVVNYGALSLSHGLSAAGYDLRLARVEGHPDGAAEFRISPGEYLLAVAEERFTMPNDVLGIVHGKATWAGRGLTVQNTVIEPGWIGYLTLGLCNHSRKPITLWKGCGIAQVVFHFLNESTTGYDGKYQNQGKYPSPAM